MPNILRGLGKTWQPFGGSGFLIILVLFVLAVLASAIFILLPLCFRLSGRLGQIGISRIRWQLFIYFSMLGVGFLFIEIPLMQNFILFLDQPTHAFVIVLFTIFIRTGLGSIASNRLNRMLPQIIFGLSLIVIVYSLFLPYFTLRHFGGNLYTSGY